MNVLQDITFHESNAKLLFIDFRIRSDILIPSEITDDLGVEPTRAWAKGEKYLGKIFDPETKKVMSHWHERPWGIWGLDTKTAVQVRKVEHHVSYLLNILEPKQDKIRHYIEVDKYLVSFYIWWETTTGHGSYEIPAIQLERLGRLCQYVEFGFLYTEEDDDIDKLKVGNE
jgi:hypothetical protein